MAAWDTLSIAQRSQLMNIYRSYGITSLSDMRRMYNESHPQLETPMPQSAPMYRNGGNLFKSGGDKDAEVKGVRKKIADRVSEYTKGLLTPEEVSIIVRHPKDFSKYLGWDESRVNELKRNLYENFYPYGYDTLAGISAINGGAGQGEPLGTTTEERMARDYLFAEYLGIPQEDRKEPSAKSMFEDSPYKPSIGNEKDTNYVRFSNNDDRNKVVDIYNSLIGNALPLPGQKRVRFKAGKKYFSHTPFDEVYSITPGKSGSNFAVVRGGSYDFKKDPYSAALGEYTIGSGFDKNRGQYISVYDKWDLNPVSAALNLPRAFTKRFENLGDVSGGFGNPISFYDRVYLDDYYGVNSRPEPDSYYGGYIIPSYVQADASKDNQFKSGGDKATLNNPLYNAAHERAMYDRLRQKELNSAQASGLLGNLSVESYLKADLKQKNGPAYGLMQAEGARQKAMKNYDYIYEFGSGLSPEEQQQLDYIINEGMYKDTPGEWRFGKGYNRAKDARKAFLNTNDVDKAAIIIQNNYLRPGKPHTQRRQGMAEYYADKYSNVFPYNMEEFEEGFMYNPHSEGGSIHIKPENRGKFTALKERTGHSASWFKEHGTPAQKKMAVFALNSRHWKKKSHGGILF